MKHVFTLFAFVLMSSGLAQVPGYAPSDDLVSWWAFSNNLTDESSAGNHCSVQGTVPFVEDRFGNDASAVSFIANAANYFSVDYSAESFEFSEGISFSLWFYSNSASGNRRVMSLGSTDACGRGFHVMQHSGHIGAVFYEGGCSDPSFGNWHGNSASTFELNTWHHLAFTCDFETLGWAIYLNGDTALAGVSPHGFEPTQIPVGLSQNFEIGRKSGVGNSFDAWDGLVDDLGLWRRPLVPSEVTQLFAAVRFGCTDPMSCNFNPEAEEDDGSCLPYDSTSGCTDSVACNYNSNALCDDGSCIYPPLNLANCDDGEVTCGAGTYWDIQSQSCVVANPSDTDFDGCVGMTDLLNLLSVFGTCVEVPWECGDPLEYQGYDYETVQIGEQCWFAENLRSENYKNGDAIEATLSNGDWASISFGAVAVYQETASSLEAYGRLYNWYAVDDSRGLCPTGWHVPVDGEWMAMEMSLGMSELEANDTGWRGTNQGSQLKLDFGWNVGGNGTDSSGFSGLPGGYRESNGNFSGAGYDGNWWSSSSDGTNAWQRFLFYDAEDVNRNVHDYRRGVSVRCIQDSE